MLKNLPANEGDLRDLSSIPELGRSPGVENGNLLLYSCLENSMDRGAWQATVHGVAKIQLSKHSCKHMDTHIWKKISKRLSYLQSRNRDTDVENKHIDTHGKREDGMNGEIETDIYTPLIPCIK